MSLEAHGGGIDKSHALQRPVEQTDVRDFDVVRKRIGINRKAVVLARDVHAAGLFVEHRKLAPW